MIPQDISTLSSLAMMVYITSQLLEAFTTVIREDEVKSYNTLSKAIRLIWSDKYIYIRTAIAICPVLMGMYLSDMHKTITYTILVSFTCVMLIDNLVAIKK